MTYTVILDVVMADGEKLAVVLNALQADSAEAAEALAVARAISRGAVETSTRRVRRTDVGA